MDESQEVYSTKQLADSLKLGSAMVRKYAVALEKLTGEDIPLKRRDGRQFSREHFSIIARAKSLVDAHNGLSVDTALQMVVGESKSGAEALAAPKTPGNTLELTEALTAAITKGNAPLLAELRELRLVQEEILRQLNQPQANLKDSNVDLSQNIKNKDEVDAQTYTWGRTWLIIARHIENWLNGITKRNKS
jgi:hypothetical protein